MRTFGLIGYPLSHSFSKKYFEEKFRSEEITDAEFLNFELKRIELLSETIVPNPELQGFSVTIPHKVSIIPFLARLSPEAREIGAVNCVKVMSDGKLFGYNTDALGFEKSILPFLENKYERALILGSGGASKAVSFVLRKLGIEFRFVSRNPQSSHEISYNDLSVETIQHFKLVVNTTPLGMFPEVGLCPPIPYEGLTPAHFLYDLIYNPAETEFLKRGKERDCLTMNGLEMLQNQAEESWRIWNIPYQMWGRKPKS